MLMQSTNALVYLIFLGQIIIFQVYCINSLRSLCFQIGVNAFIYQNALKLW